MRIVPKRPKNLRQRICEAVAREYSKRTPITPRMVDRCWKEWRRMVRKARRELADYVPDPNNAAVK